jgi:AmiR/NasT family two-component response regulator
VSDPDRIRTALRARTAGRAEQLQHALTSRIVIEQAKGVLAERGNLDMDEAFERLRRHARTNTRLTDVAHGVVEGTLDSRTVLAAGPARGKHGPPH